jgi:hypothetical protein
MNTMHTKKYGIFNAVAGAAFLLSGAQAKEPATQLRTAFVAAQFEAALRDKSVSFLDCKNVDKVRSIFFTDKEPIWVSPSPAEAELANLSKSRNTFGLISCKPVSLDNTKTASAPSNPLRYDVIKALRTLIHHIVI